VRGADGGWCRSTNDAAMERHTMTTTLEQTKVALHWIDRGWVHSDEHVDSVNPATGEVIGGFALGSPREAQLAIAAANRAFAAAGWRTDRALRARVLNRMAERFEARVSELVDMLALENGKTKP
jgi:betaine-aldehyde dehydrogenase